jgi:hypothetical protein
MVPLVVGLAIQVHSGKLDGLHLSHGVKLQVSIQLLHPCLCCHLSRTIKVWNLYLPFPSLKLKDDPVVHPRMVSEPELKILLSLKFRPHMATRTPHRQNRTEVIHGTGLIPQHCKRVKNYTK